MGRKPRCSKDGLKKGAWTTLEDEMLRDYVKIHGEGKWSNIVKETGLNRCGKSCRLRWMNYLTPNIKRGNISDDEEDLIIRLHKLLGNRWSLIAGRLPGRTDNEIKNYWHTNIAKKAQHSQFRRQPRVQRNQVASRSQNGAAASNFKKDDTDIEPAGVVPPATALQENNIENGAAASNFKKDDTDIESAGVVPPTTALQESNIAQDHQETTLAMATSMTYEINESSSKAYNDVEDLCKFLDSDFPKLSEINGLINITAHHPNNTSEVDGDHYSVSINGCSSREMGECFPEKLSEAEWSSNICVQADEGFEFMSLLSFLDSTDEEWTEDVLGTNILP